MGSDNLRPGLIQQFGGLVSFHHSALLCSAPALVKAALVMVSR